MGSLISPLLITLIFSSRPCRAVTGYTFLDNHSQDRWDFFTGSSLWVFAFLGCFVGYTRGGLSQSHQIYRFISFSRIFTIWLIFKRWTPENGEMNLEVGIVLVIDVNMNNSFRPSNLYRKQGLYFIHNLKQSRSLKDKINLFAKNCNQCSVNLKGQYQSKGFNPFNEYSTFRKKKRSDIVSTINNV